MGYQIDLNSDLGESFGAYQIGKDSDIIPLISSANVACGFHAGDPLVISTTAELAKENRTAVGAHPGFPDLAGFGRRNLAVSLDEARALLLYQIGALDAFLKVRQISLQHVKPHGALYNMACADRKLANALAQAIAAYDENLILLCPGNSELALAGKASGLRIAREVFADRAYENDGSLVDRRKAGAVIHDENFAVQRLIQIIKRGSVDSIDGKTISLEADSVCVHGDSVQALSFIQKIRQTFKEEGIVISPLADIVR